MKVYVKKIKKNEGKELFKGEKLAIIEILTKDKLRYTYNLIGCYDHIEIGQELMIYSTKTQKFLYYGYIINKDKKIVNENTINDFLVLK